MKELYLGGTGSATSLSRKAGETGIYMSNSSVLLSLEFSLLVLGMTVPDIFLLAVGMGRLVDLMDLLTGVIKPTKDSLPKKYRIRQPQWFTALGVKNPAGCFSSDFSAWRCSEVELLAGSE